MDKKAQGALEYLLLIGGAVLVAVIIIAVITTMGRGADPGNAVNIGVNKIETAITKEPL